MLSLNTHLPLEVVKSNKKLSNINDIFCYEIDKIDGEVKITYSDGSPMKKHCEYIPAPTISDIIDNAEMLFGSDTYYRIWYPEGIEGDYETAKELFEFYRDSYKDLTIDDFSGKSGSFGCYDWGVKHKCKDIAEEIFNKCFYDKSIKEISKYIISNINYICPN